MTILKKVAFGALMGTTALVASQAAHAQAADEIVVRGSRIPDEKRATSEISAVIDEESFARTGDGDIASALGRVTGLSLSEGKFVIVRGLNERYSAVTIDGSPLPSPEPLRRVPPLDIIPTSILSGSLVQKTFSPQFSAEFGGGLVELRTKSVPDENYFQIGLSVGLDTATTGQNGLTFDGGSTDFLGFDDGARDIPQPLVDAFFGRNGLNFDPAQQNIIDASLDSTQTTVIFEDTIPPAYGVSVAFGGYKDLSDDITVGANVALGFDNDFQTREGRREQGFTTTGINSATRAFEDPSLSIPNGAFSTDFISTSQTVGLNGAATFGVEIGDNHEIKSTNLILRSTLKDARITRGIDGDDESLEVFQENFEFFERQVWQTQLRGEHVFPALADLGVTWRGAYGRAFRDAPYQRQFRRIRDSATGEFFFPFGVNEDFDNDAATITFSEVEDENIDAGIDFVLPLTIAQQAADLKFGYAYTDKERTSSVREFFYQVGSLGSVPQEVLFARPDVLVSPGVAGSDALDLAFTTNPIALDNADSSLRVHAGYGQFDVELGSYLRLAAGVRFETGEQVTEAFATGTPITSFTRTVIDEDYFLPAATVTWNPLGNLQVRAGFSQTITRPQFRELTPATFLDDDTDQLIIGNPFLINTEIDNYDIRAEYYLARGQFVTIGAFYKDITNPIEVTSTQIGGAEAQTYVNAPSAELYGLEFEYEQNFVLGDWFEGGFWQSRDLIFKANYTWSQSDVSSDGDVITANPSLAGPITPTVTPGAGFIVDGRSLQGQSDHLFNLQLGLENADTNSKATLLVNWASSRIRQTANIITGAPDVVERPPVLVDFVWSRDLETFGGDWEIRMAVRNILGEDYEATQTFADGTSADFDVYSLGREISVGLTKRF